MAKLASITLDTGNELVAAAPLSEPSSSVTKLRHTQIRTNGGTQMRDAINETTAGEYADELRRGTILPPVIVFHDGSDYWLGDGFHRVRAYFMAYGSDAQIPAEVRPGTRRDAILCAAGANGLIGRLPAAATCPIRSLVSGANSSLVILPVRMTILETLPVWQPSAHLFTTRPANPPP